MLKLETTYHEPTGDRVYTRVVEGAGGGGKGGGDQPREAADTLFSNSQGQAVDLLSEGEIEGLVGGFEGIFYNEVPYEVNGTKNFRGANIALNKGTPDQPAMPGFDDVRTSVPVAQDLPFNVYKTVSFPNDGLHTAVEVTLSTNNFFKVEDDGDTVGTNVTFVIEISENGGAFVQAISGRISGKQKDEYTVAYRIPIGDTDGNTAVRVKRTKADSTSLKDNDEITFKLYTKVTEHMLAYPNCAVAGHQFDAKQFGNKVPTRQYHLKGIKVSVPSNYDPVTRTYSGPWNGALSGTKVYTNNPAWIFYDLATNTRYGLGQFIDSSYIDLPSLYNIGKWCDDLLPKGTAIRTASSVVKSGTTYTVSCTGHGFKDGDYVEVLQNGTTLYASRVVENATSNTFAYTDAAAPAAPTGTITFKHLEPRWACNTVITKQGEAFDVLREMASCFRGIMFWMEAKLWAMADMPQTAIKIVNNANVIEGVFTYSGESRRKRFSVVKVAWNDPAIMYRRATETYEDDDLIREIGWKPTSYGAFGCTSRSQARRLAKAILYEQENGSEIVTYRASFDHLATDGDEGPVGVAPGDVIYIADSERGNAVAGGRILSVSGSTITLDRNTGDTGTGASIYIEHADGTVETVACNYSASTVTLTGTPTGTVAANDLFILIDSGAQAEPFRVVKISEVEQNIYEVAAVRWNEGKFNDVYGEEQYEEEDIMGTPDPQISVPPTGPVNFVEGYIYNTDRRSRTLELSWTPADDPFLHYYLVSYSKDEDNWVDLPPTSAPGFKMEDVRYGNYEFRITAINRVGIASQPLTATYFLAAVPDETTLPVGSIANLSLDQGGTTFGGRDAKLNWDLSTPTGEFLTSQSVTGVEQGIADPAFRDCVVEVYTTGGALLRTESVVDTFYAYTWEKNAEDNGGTPLRSFRVDVTYRDIYGRSSTPATVTVNNTAPTWPVAPTATAVLEGVLVKVTEPTDIDYAGMKVYADLTANGVTTDPSDLVYKGPGDSVLIPALGSGEHSVIVVPYDSFGDGTPSATLTATPSVGSGSASAPVLIYQRASSTPTLPSASVTYTFATGGMTGLNNGWSASVPAGSDPLYVSRATAFGTGSTDTIAPGEWASPVILAQDGTSGTNGTDGLNQATVVLFQRAAAAPAVPSTTSTYTFATGSLTGFNNGWTTSAPDTNGNPLWTIRASAISTGATDTIPTGEWSAPERLVVDGTDGADGADGADGLNNATVFIYRRSASTPALPSVTTTYTFATKALTGLNNSWTQTIPAGTDPLYVAVATASSSTATDTIANNEWSSPVVLAQNGTNGTSGLNSASVFLYQRAASTPAVPSTTATYTFATGVLTGHNNGWTQTVPAANGNPLYVTTATAASTGATDTIATGEWATVRVLAQDGATGAPGANNAVVVIYKRATTAGSLPSATTTFTFATGALTGLNNGWSTNYPAVNGTLDPVWASTATASSSTATDTIAAGEWTTPVKFLGGLGNYDTIDWSNGSLWNNRDVWLTDGRVPSGLNGSGVITQPIPTTIRNSSNLLGYTGGATFIGDLNADLTSANTAAAITGQSAWATYTDAGAQPAKLAFMDQYSTSSAALNAGWLTDSLDKWWTSFGAGKTTGTTIGQGASGWSGGVTVQTNQSDAPVGSSFIRFIDNDDGGEQVFSEAIPVDLTKTYRVSVWLRQTGDRREYIAVAAKDSAGANIQANAADGTGWPSKGTYHYFGLANQAAPASFTKYEILIGPNGQATLPTGTKSVHIGMLPTRDGPVGTNTTLDVCGFKIEEVIPNPWALISDPFGTKPANNADVTSANTAAAIAGQGAFATQNLVYAGQMPFLGGENLWPDPQIVGTQGLLIGSGTSCTVSRVTTGIDSILALLGANGALRFQGNGANTSGGTEFPNAEVRDATNEKIKIRVPTGVSAYLASFRYHCDSAWTAPQNLRLELQCYNSAGAVVGYPSAFFGTTLSAGTTGTAKGVCTLPAGTAYFTMVLVVGVSNGQSVTGRVYCSRMEVKPLNPLTNIARDNGTTLLSDALAVTSLGTAAAISGQGSLATLNAANWSTQVTGTGKPEDYADVTATAQRTIIPQFPVIEIKENEAGHTGNRTVTHTAKKGTTTLTGGTWSLPSTNLSGGSASISSSTGTVTLSSITASGAYTVRYTHTDGIVTELPVNVTFVAAASGGSASAKTGTTTSNTGVMSGTGVWSQVISLTLTNCPAGRVFFNSGGNGLEVVSGTGTCSHQARLKVNGVVQVTTTGKSTVAGGIPELASFFELFQSAYNVASGTVTVSVEMARTSGTGTITEMFNSLDCTVIAT